MWIGGEHDVNVSRVGVGKVSYNQPDYSGDFLVCTLPSYCMSLQQIYVNVPLSSGKDGRRRISMADRKLRGVCVRARLVHLRRRVNFRALVQQQPHDLEVAVFRRGDRGGPPVLPGQEQNSSVGVG
jgi:hypothetical protein